MKLDEALPILKSACNIPFRDLFKDHPEDLLTNTGNVGQLLLKYIGLSLDSALCDFEDGELKTNKTHANGEPAETMFITQISGIIDELVAPTPKRFEESNLYIKIRNLVFLPVVKDSKDTGNWYFLNAYHIHAPFGSVLFTRLESDYYSICEQLRTHIETSPDGFIHTSSGELIQIRSKDAKDKSGKYHPIFSTIFNRYVSNKNHSFYFKKEFMREYK